jgi:hypothetical protein
MANHPDKAALLLIEMGRFLTKYCGNMNKMYESVFVLNELEKQKKSSDGPSSIKISHVKHTYGPDIIIANNENGIDQGYEIKTSQANKEKNYRVNWMINVDNTGDFKKAYHSVYNHMKNGCIVLIAMYDGLVLNQYVINGHFISLYLAKSSLKSKVKVERHVMNLGSERCSICEKYHRMEHIEKYAKSFIDKMDKNPFDIDYEYFSEQEWKDILKSIQSECKEKK